ncbi:alpha/beta hydrolase [Rhizobium sp. ICMP 5592]|uniref:alpha/beta hydrolase n=1 Tax=Rhizobium sp. ICMP 5592 TaxID=2292445 RepID=UPI00129807A7|nr:alpha/beta hydrolase [Rhizobium sp. ICMP 5592]MQB45665.1 alpha/beta hydrolase [Rhizobium sp. ICMP 5592]
MAGWGAAEYVDTVKEITPAAVPVTFAGTVGLFMAAAAPPSRTAVLFLSPWGFEEMCARKFWRILAEDFAKAGIASLRFDYAGTGDALDVADQEQGLPLWEDTALAAASMLRSLSGCERLILMSQGLGSVVALDIAERLTAVDGIALLAPTISGRAYLRELTIWSKMIDESMGLDETQRQTEGVTVASLRMPDAIAATVKTLNLMTRDHVSAPDCLVLTRPGRPGDTDFATHLGTLGTRVEQAAYDGYDELVSNPTIAAMPLDAGRKILDWVQSIAMKPVATSRKILHAPRAEALEGDGFRETPLRFGEGDRLFGILCEPMGERTGATAMLLTTAYDRHAGWGRTSVAMARALACEGIASLRFDTANVADSPPLPDAPEQVLYSREQHLDVRAALDLLEARRLLPTFAVGRCSGGYLAFQTAISDERCHGLITVNPYAFFWDETQSVDEALRFVPRSLETYGQKFLQLETLKRLYGGQIDAKSAARNIVTALARRAVRLGRPLLGVLPFFAGEHEIVMGGFRTLARRRVDISLIYSAHDIGLDHFHEHFGEDASALRNFPDIRLTIIPGADHNLTPPYARKVYLREVREMGLRLGKR